MGLPWQRLRLINSRLLGLLLESSLVPHPSSEHESLEQVLYEYPSVVFWWFRLCTKGNISVAWVMVLFILLVKRLN